MIKAIIDLAKELGNFVHLAPPEMTNGESELILREKDHLDAAKQWVPGYKFDIMEISNNDYAGSIDFRVALTEKMTKYGGHIGYSIELKYRGKRYAAKSINLIKPFIKQHGISEVLITCDPENIASRRTCEIAGAQLDSIIKDVEIEPNVFRDTCRYIINL